MGEYNYESGQSTDGVIQRHTLCSAHTVCNFQHIRTAFSWPLALQQSLYTNTYKTYEPNWTTHYIWTAKPQSTKQFFLHSIVQLVLKTGPNNSWTSFAELKTPWLNSLITVSVFTISSFTSQVFSMQTLLDDALGRADGPHWWEESWQGSFIHTNV